MVHQRLFENGKDGAHTSDGWRREIMHLTKLITGKQIWSGKSITKRVEGSDGIFRRPLACGSCEWITRRPQRFPRPVE